MLCHRLSPHPDAGGFCCFRAVSERLGSIGTGRSGARLHTASHWSLASICHLPFFLSIPACSCSCSFIWPVGENRNADVKPDVEF